MNQTIVKQVKSWGQGARRWLPWPANESGQSIIILTFAFLGMLAMLGLALDLGLVYVERIRLKRTVDAAALAAVSELPNEEGAALRAIDYLRQNGYNVDRSQVYVAGCVQDTQNQVSPSGTTDLVNFPTGVAFNWSTLPVTGTLPISSSLFYHYKKFTTTEPVSRFYIDTHSFTRDDATVCDTGIAVKNAARFGGASRLRVYGEVPVRMSFMQFFGFPEITVSDQAIAQNASSLDVAVVFDVTSSMELDTICYDCWRRCDQLPAGMSCGSDNKFSDYPKNGRALPYDFYSNRMQTLITGDPVPANIDTPSLGNKPYIIIEAEFYTNNTSTWDPASRTAGVGYWALQRRLGGQGYSIDGYGYLGSTDNRSGFVRHHPYVDAEGGMGTQPFGRHYTLDDAKGLTAFKAPRLDYRFIPQWNSATGDPTYIYLRMQAFIKYDYGNSAPFDQFYWAIDNGTPQDTRMFGTGGGSLSTNHTTARDDTRITNDWRTEPGTTANPTWHWIKLGPVNLSETPHTLRIWAGSAGLALDRIVITNQSSINDEIKQHAATAGSAEGMATDPCNPIFGLQVTNGNCTSGLIELPDIAVNNLDDPLFGDYAPYRGSSEAVKAFVARLDPELDQAGLVTFVANPNQRAQLECLKASAFRKIKGGPIANYPGPVPGVEYDENTCFDKDAAVSGQKPISFTNVFIELEKVRDTDLQGGTNIAAGLRRGQNLLGLNPDGGTTHDNSCNWTKNGAGTNWLIGGQTQPNDSITSHCSRGQAATPIIVLLTDGSPTKSDGLPTADCNNFTSTHPLPYEAFVTHQGDAKYECILYYADKARQNGVIVYVIGLGNGVDHELLNAAAEMTFGQYYYAPSPAALNFIFDQILANVYISLVQ